MAKTMIFVSYLALFISSFLTCECQPFTEAADSNINGFTIDLIHRDSPISPFYDPLSTDFQRLENAVKRSRIRGYKIVNQSKAAESVVTGAPDGEYVMRFLIGTPSGVVIGVVDTGSHLTWTQCKPCNKCVKQRRPFNPAASSTFRHIRCDSNSCDLYAPSTECDRRREKCLYNVQYGDKSYSRGVIATERFSFLSTSGRLLGFNNTLFGCGRDNYFSSNSAASGVVGLAGGSGSLVRQLGYDKFSYCLTLGENHKKTSKLHFGVDAVVSGRGAVTTPLDDRSTYYYLTLEAITVGNKRIEYHSPFIVAGANIIIDSGSVLTLFPVNFYEEFEAALANQIEARAVRDFGNWRLCYAQKIVMPRITVHFRGGADVEWRLYNTFVRASPDFMCLAVDAMEGLPLYGSLAQVDYMVGYDLGMKTLSFKPTDCALN